MLLWGLPLLDFAQDSLNRDYCSYYNRYYNHADNLCNENPWILVFEDDFIGYGLDKSVWITRPSDGSHLRPGNEQQYYNFDGNYKVDNGIIDLIAKNENPPLYEKVYGWKDDDEILIDGIPNRREFKYSSCNIETKRKYSNGKFEARVRLPRGKGFWPAFWLFGKDQKYNELDIFEFWNEKDIWGNFDPDKLSKVHIMTSHFESAEQQCHRERNYGIDFSDDFNDFGVKWERNSIRWYVNGDRKWKKNKLRWGRCIVEENNSYGTNITQPEEPMCIILNLAIQGNDSIPENSPDATTPFPSKLQADWVRVWYRMDLGNTVISVPSQCSLHDELFNVVTGNNVTMDCDYVVLRGQQLSISASENVILKSGFVAETGSVFNARSKQPIYDDKSDKSVDDDEDDFDDFLDDSADNQIVEDDLSIDGFHLSTKGYYSSSNSLYIYPNPNRGAFRIQLPSSEFGKCSVSITDPNGHLVYYTEADGAENVSIDITSLPHGVYLLYVVSLDSGYNNIQKIILI